MSNIIESLNWRYATKKFDSTKKISESDIQVLKEAMRLTASSFGLQPYKIIFVENPELRTKLVSASWGQVQVAEASHLVVIASEKIINDDYIDSFGKNTAQTRNQQMEEIEGYIKFIKGYFANIPDEAKAVWATKQTYIVLGNLLNVAAELKIDSTPMEGFVPAQYDEILGLDKLNLTASLVIPLGYRHDEDALQNLKKVRKPETDMFITL